MLRMPKRSPKASHAPSGAFPISRWRSRTAAQQTKSRHRRVARFCPRSTPRSIPRVQASIEEAGQKLKDNELSFRAQAGVELSQSQAEYAKLAETIPVLEDRVARTTVRSPVKGIVKTVVNKSLGGVIQPGSDGGDRPAGRYPADLLKPINQATERALREK